MNQKAARGKILIAEPFLGDPNFERSVVLLCEHNPEGSFGFVLNQSSNLRLGDVIEGVYVDFPLYIGGPVEQNTLHFIHRLGDMIDHTVEIGNGIYWSGDFESLRTLINIGKISENDIRLFLGYSGWGTGQLDAELGNNSWILSDIDAATIFDSSPQQFWRIVLKKKGGDFKVLSNYPTDPRLN
jgi:putative transcriptional regulator